MSIDAASHRDRSQDGRPFTLVLFGRRCTQTIVTLRRLLREDVAIGAVIIPSSRDFGPFVRQVVHRPMIRIAREDPSGGLETVDQLAADHAIPILEVRRPMSEELVHLLGEISPDLLVASCFPWRIPNALIRASRFGAINLHPSLLPGFRGPDPLFWALQTGASAWGVTVHTLTNRFDSGPILKRREFELTSEIIDDSFEKNVSEIGAETLVAAIDDIRAGNIHLVVQSESSATYFGYPTELELEIQPDWTIARALRFVVGASQLGHRPTVRTDRGILTVRSARPADSRRHADRLSADRLTLELSDGLLDLTVEPTETE